MVDEPKFDINWESVDKAIHDIHKMLYENEAFTLIEIDLIIYTLWTNTQKDKIVQLAFNDINSILKQRLDNALITAEKKQNAPKGPFYG